MRIPACNKSNLQADKKGNQGHQRDNFIDQWLQTEDDQVVILSTSCLFQGLWKGLHVGVSSLFHVPNGFAYYVA